MGGSAPPFLRVHTLTGSGPSKTMAEVIARGHSGSYFFTGSGTLTARISAACLAKAHSASATCTGMLGTCALSFRGQSSAGSLGPGCCICGAGAGAY